MKAAVVVFPGSNCDRDLKIAFETAGFSVEMVWHKDTSLPSSVDIVGIPGGFSFGDYLRCGAIAAQSTICSSIRAYANQGGYIIGICNGFQLLTEAGLLPGVLLRNAELKYICKTVQLKVDTVNSIYTGGYSFTDIIDLPIAHHDGNYFADSQTISELRNEERIAFRYVENPNGSLENIAGILSPNRRILGMMPHPERALVDAHGGTDGAILFRSMSPSSMSI
ncbi:MAG: phosphoribosylformylglycinamidine synthase subunit PurQ [Aestuariivita sp.]|nr:phosphoribosylformylglycinamidine synthase subunit PurQ [Aestuariivita sp.]